MAKVKAKRKTLPKDIEALLKEGDFAKITAALEACEPDARASYGNRTALALPGCTDELTRWLVARGATLDAMDTWGNTPLQNRISHGGEIDVLLELGANVHHTNLTGVTLLHTAAESIRERYVQKLLEAGVKVDVPNKAGKTALEFALERAHNARLPALVRNVKLLLDAGAEKRPSTQAFVKRIGETFEFYRAGSPAGVSSDSVAAAAAAAVEELYALFDVPPVPKRSMHDGTSPIGVPEGTWERKHAALWDLLVPASGAARTVQGEVVRIAGRIADEIQRNGGVNWDGDYRAMADAYVTHVAGGTALPAADVATVRRILRDRPKDTEVDELRRLAVLWVEGNPTPIALAPPSYAR